MAVFCHALWSFLNPGTKNLQFVDRLRHTLDLCDIELKTVPGQSPIN